MNFRSKESQQTLELNLTPLIDVVFLLLIFFMVSTTFDKPTRLKVQLPEAVSENELDQTVNKIEVVIQQNGDYFINGHPLANQTYKTLKKALKKKANGNQDLPVIIRADKKVPYQFVVKVMDVASQLGLNRLVFSTNKPKK